MIAIPGFARAKSAPHRAPFLLHPREGKEVLEMHNRKLETSSVAVLVAVVALGSAACQKRPETVVVVVTPTAGAVPAASNTPVAELQPADTSTITADPIVVSQRNAVKRRTASQSKKSSSTAASSTREGRPGYSEEKPAPAEPARAPREIPQGTILRVAFDQAISTATAQVGDTVRGKLLDDVLADDGSVVARSGSRVTGKIEHVVDSGKLARPAELRFRLTDLETRSGTVPIRTSAYDRVGDTHTKRNVEYIAGGAAVGAILGQVLGKDTGSTLKGAAAGAAVGTGVAAATGDLDFTIDAGRTVAFTLEEPVIIR
ncbi:MAG TPA: hypothetical protein VLE54_01035 [Thermoanaerobaculia bacterium]|nr:hypothetical protein [Thermoanaerobaculia bacterium]